MPSFISPIPLFFVLLWSTGFIVAKFGLPYAPPLTFLLLRYACAVAVLAPLVWLVKAPWPKGKAGHIAVADPQTRAAFVRMAAEDPSGAVRAPSPRCRHRHAAGRRHPGAPVAIPRRRHPAGLMFMDD